MTTDHGPDPGVAQFAVSASDMPRAAQLYVDVIGCLKAGGLLIWGDFLATLQKVPDPAAALWWLIDRQDFVQLEVWGYTRMSFHVDDFDGVVARIPTVGASTITDPQGNALIPWCDHPEHGGARQAAAA